jgi:hypothetical protein
MMNTGEVKKHLVFSYLVCVPVTAQDRGVLNLKYCKMHMWYILQRLRMKG